MLTAFRLRFRCHLPTLGTRPASQVHADGAATSIVTLSFRDPSPALAVAFGCDLARDASRAFAQFVINQLSFTECRGAPRKAEAPLSRSRRATISGVSRQAQIRLLQAVELGYNGTDTTALTLLWVIRWRGIACGL